MAEIGERNEQTSVATKNYLKGFYAQTVSLYNAYHSVAANGVDVTGLKILLHSMNHRAGIVGT